MAGNGVVVAIVVAVAVVVVVDYLHHHPLQGILNVTSEVLVETNVLLHLWKHECQRVIADRFTNQVDKDWFEKAVRTVVEEDIGTEMVEVIQEDQYFVDFMRDAPEITGQLLVYIVKLINNS